MGTNLFLNFDDDETGTKSGGLKDANSFSTRQNDSSSEFRWRRRFGSSSTRVANPRRKNQRRIGRSWVGQNV